jgi:hypothetical protein
MPSYYGRKYIRVSFFIDNRISSFISYKIHNNSFNYYDYLQTINVIRNGFLRLGFKIIDKIDYNLTICGRCHNYIDDINTSFTCEYIRYFDIRYLFSYNMLCDKCFEYEKIDEKKRHNNSNYYNETFSPIIKSEFINSNDIDDVFIGIHDFKEKDIYVYLFKSGLYHKIGISENPKYRLQSIQTSNPNKIEQVYQIKRSDAKNVEYNLHKIFKNKRVSGEWFNLNDDDLKLLKSLVVKSLDDIKSYITTEQNLSVINA